MRTRTRLVISTLAILAIVATATPASGTLVSGTLAAAQQDSDGPILELYDMTGSLAQFDEASELGVEVLNYGAGQTARAIAPVALEDEIRALGVTTTRVVGEPSPGDVGARGGFSVWRNYSDPGGIRDEVEQIAADNPDLVKLITIGQSVQGQPIYALKVTADANTVADGSRPAAGYISAQHAREWITVETNRRLLHHVVDGFGNDPQITSLLSTTELWFVVVANPDGYDFTFSNERLWRKNLRNNDGGGISFADGVDLNRNFPTRWGYDNEGSSPSQNSQVYRGPAPSSEPETQALNAMFEMADLEFFFNIHSAVGLMIHGSGWQAATESPDDHIGRALLGDDANPAIDGYNAGVGAELYIVNGDTNEHAQNVHGAFSIVMELETCQQAEALLPNDGFGAGYCNFTGRSPFEFPDDEALIELVFQRNLPLYLAGAESAASPEAPVSVVGYTTPDIAPHAYEVGHGTTQLVSADVKRTLGAATMKYRINGGADRSVATSESGAGNRYGDQHRHFYADVRGEVVDAIPGDAVEVWFEAGGRTSEPFTYQVTSAGADVLVIAHEDYEGFNPIQPGVTEPKYAQTYVDALSGAGYTSEVWDVVRQGVPDPLGVLGQYAGVVWELGDNRITQEADDVATEFFGFSEQELAVAEVQQFLTLAIRDYMNEGGRVVAAGQYTGWFSSATGGLGGYFFAADGDVEAPCVVQESILECVLYADDFAEYYLGIAESYEATGNTSVSGTGSLSGFAGTFVDSSSANELAPISVEYSPEEFPQFASRVVAEYPSGIVAGIQTDNAFAFAFGLEDITSPGDRSRLLELAFADLGVESGQTCGGLPVTVFLAAGDVPTPQRDVIAGTDGPDFIAAGDGDDVICGYGGDDDIYGQGGDDVVIGGTGNDKIRGGDGNDELRGGGGNDDLAGGRGDDLVLGQVGDDVAVRGGTGDDIVDGGDGNDALVAGNGGSDTVYGGEGDDVLVTGGPRPDELSGGAGNDVVKGNKGADVINGDAGDDELRGGPQPDQLDGGAGTDVCNGGTSGEGAPESDTAVFCEQISNVP